MRPIPPVCHIASGGEKSRNKVVLDSFPDHIPPQLEVLYTSLIPRSHSTSTGGPVHLHVVYVRGHLEGFVFKAQDGWDLWILDGRWKIRLVTVV